MTTTPTRITPATMPGAPPRPPRPPEPEQLDEAMPLTGEFIPWPNAGQRPDPTQPETLVPTPLPPRPALAGLDRHQHMRRVALELAVRHYHDLECTPDDVLATAKAWNHWIRTGNNPPTAP